MKTKIKKSETFLCIKNYEENGEIIFHIGCVYKSKMDGAISDGAIGNHYTFSDKTFDRYFVFYSIDGEGLLPFDLEEYKKNPDRLRYMDGDKPIKSKWDEDFKAVISSWEGEGALASEECDFMVLRLADLFKEEYWINVYTDNVYRLHSSCKIYPSKKAAFENRLIYGYLKTIQIEL